MEEHPTPHQAQQKARRISVFKEVGLKPEEINQGTKRQSRPDLRKLRFRSKPDVFEYSDETTTTTTATTMAGRAAGHKKNISIEMTNPVDISPYMARPGGSLLYRFSAAAFVLAILVPLLHGTPWFGHASVPVLGVKGGVIRRERQPIMEYEAESLVRRTDSPTDICVRWSQQSAVVNGTLYIYGGQASTETGQTENTWNNDFLAMDLTKSWQISTPSLAGLPQPSGPPNVSNGYLWNSHDSLYLYGGEFSWKPAVSPSPVAIWEYNIPSSSWIEHSDPTTSSGNNSAADEQPLQRAAEGAGVTVPSLGRGFYFGGHQDGYTTEGWSQSIYRIYLTSLLEFTFPGYTNTQVNALSDNQVAGTDGNYRNITTGGSQDTAGFPERADGLLLYVPGFSTDGILIGLAGGTNTTFQQMNIVDVYDIATSTWYKQATSGPIPNMRVNPCAVVAAAPDGSSYNVYMFGGQNLQPASNQTQYNDMWILTIPSFTWIEVDQSSQSVPYGRSGHTCNIWDGQMIVVGGYVGTELSCDSPGIYVYDLSTLTWVEKFTATSAAANSTSSGSSSGSSTATDASQTSSSTFVSNSRTNPFNQQPAQLSNSTNAGGLEGSYGYEVPKAVVSIIGGGTTGGATVTAPAQTATDGPLATGKPQTYTVTQPNGATVTETSTPGSSSGGNGDGSSNSNSSGKSGPNVGAIVAGVIAGIFFLLACYLAFCAWLYRKQLKLYKRHVEMAQRQALHEKPPAIPAFLATADSSSKSSSDRRRPDGTKVSSEAASAAGSSAQGAWGHRYDRYGGGSGGSASGAQVSLLRRSSESSGEGGDLLSGNEPSFWGTMLAPRRSLRIVNRD
ncbi:hypothetical protein MBLNU459_g4381t1 [Dothideomycetes sp. NU459]